ncbi:MULTISPECIES: type VI secretion system baseplate subunit TssE [Achromobacter]|jgi:type VI secretion system protein|uniref:Type VI secretion system baseplate subunit TssE n=2 Tax=Achromobacter spanius TaxID=217203 RepID=A0ABY8GMX2_9BURK|nr:MULTISPECIES: type VI secretion system baseplate subunit TssE [Achromobacter]SPT41664.1 type VI secretion system lysozyme-like protein [Achromobacter denitrificans]AUA56079.1 type VI secretion system baseplate subunit TssE [Achromobacter spanius]WAI84586.1 type VI secretion system baseplate subunit TssE [Achromobacter spanius]WEX94671.1 type VI secretion system baseplate subunit TssE [Achromobacter sp. SS2-2022]WFP06165.1 type VI secretion system baseplate subunit TssE [Achromobacter spaniu
MREHRLLERIASLGSDVERSHITRAEVLVDSILDHLRRILNTRQGSVPIDLSFGVPDFTNLAGSFSSGTTTQMIEDIGRMIQRYEPRLRQPQITFTNTQDEVLSLGFAISGFIAVDDREIPVRLASHVASNGKVSLRRQ